ncbi:MAG TPA: hypothetical protein VGK34_05095, partial [Armatimonadota bacterium]
MRTILRDWLSSCATYLARRRDDLKRLLDRCGVKRLVGNLRAFSASHPICLAGRRGEPIRIFGVRGTKRLSMILLYSAVLLIGIPLLTRMCVHRSSQERISSRIEDVPACRVAVVLGAKVYPSGRLADLLADRVDAAI